MATTGRAVPTRFGVVGAPGAVWVAASGGYELALDGTTLRCRNGKGRVLRSIPKPVRESTVAERLRALADWLARHEAACLARVEAWMLGSVPVPTAVIAGLWVDSAWRDALGDAVVAAGGEAGFLRGIDEAGRAGIVTLDGETRWLSGETLVIPHPVLLDDLDDLRELALELGAGQGVQQLLRDTYRKPRGLDEARGQAGAFADGYFAELRHATGRAAGLGFRVRGGYAVCRAFDGGVPVEVRYWLGADEPEWPTWTGELVWVDSEERRLTLDAVGPVAWSEGIRMASLVYAGRAGSGEG